MVPELITTIVLHKVSIFCFNGKFIAYYLCNNQVIPPRQTVFISILVSWQVNCVIKYVSVIILILG